MAKCCKVENVFVACCYRNIVNSRGCDDKSVARVLVKRLR